MDVDGHHSPLWGKALRVAVGCPTGYVCGCVGVWVCVCVFLYREERYEIRSQIGEGTYGVVYKAYDHQDETLVALKKIRTDQTEVVDVFCLCDVTP